MTKRILFALDDSETACGALRNLGGLLAPGEVHLHLFHAAPETSHFHPGELSSLSGEPGPWEKTQAEQAGAILKRADELLQQLGFTPARIEREFTRNSSNAAQEILAASERQAPSAIALARKGRSGVTRFLLGSTTAQVCQYAEGVPVWVVGSRPLEPPRVLAAIDESPYADRVAAHVGEHFGRIAGSRVTLFHVIAAKPPGFWDDGHILDETERSERTNAVARWRREQERQTENRFNKAKAALAAAGMREENIALVRQAMAAGIARDILAEAARGGYNILVFGRRGASAIKEFALGSRAAKILHSPSDLTLVLVG
jgi:nucleotide-binding universal stress UspA family protein